MDKTSISVSLNNKLDSSRDQKQDGETLGSANFDIDTFLVKITILNVKYKKFNLFILFKVLYMNLTDPLNNLRSLVELELGVKSGELKDFEFWLQGILHK